jgi:hypothetical protein
MTQPEIISESVYRITADTKFSNEWRSLCSRVPWVPESIVIFDYQGMIRSDWTDAVEDLSEDRTFPFPLRGIPTKRGAIAFRLDSDAIQFFLSIA